ncbi:hypothetical protein ACIP3D_10285 [Streptomyces longwoodensis]|uniref:hypothetical protein n=1 Tax=Streptomyces longwoodensis TaxID=68231 RepID=UPI00380ED0C8
MLPLTPSLPPGYHCRPCTPEDVPVLHALVADCERDLYGRSRTDAGAVAADLRRPGLVPELDTVLVHDRHDRVVARAWVDRRVHELAGHGARMGAPGPRSSLR